MSEELNTNNTGAEQATETTTETKTYTEEEVQALLQSESDRRVSAALKKAEQKNAEKVREAQKLANMDATQKYEYELQQREAAIAAKEAELALSENKNVCAKILADKGLSLDFVEFVVDTEADAMNEKIKRVERAFKASVKAEVEKRLGSNAPKQNLPMDNTITKEQFMKIKDPVKLMEFKNEQPELWAEFTR